MNWWGESKHQYQDKSYTLIPLISDCVVKDFGGQASGGGDTGVEIGNAKGRRQDKIKEAEGSFNSKKSTRRKSTKNKKK